MAPSAAACDLEFAARLPAIRLSVRHALLIYATPNEYSIIEKMLRLGAWEGRAGRCRGAHIAWRERPLQQVFEIGALPVLDVIDVPPAGCRLFDSPFQPEKPPRLVDVARLSRYDEHGIHPRHRNDAHDAGKWTVIVDAKNLFEFRSKSIRGFVAGRKQCVGLSGERIDIEGADQSGQGLAHRRIATDDQGVAPLIGGGLSALGNIGVGHLYQILRRRIAKRHDLRPRSDCRRPNRDIGGRTGAKRHDAVDAV